MDKVITNVTGEWDKYGYTWHYHHRDHSIDDVSWCWKKWDEHTRILQSEVCKEIRKWVSS